MRRLKGTAIIALTLSLLLAPRAFAQLSGSATAPQQTAMLSRLQESLDTWIAKRDEHQGSYQYMVEFSSWAGFRTTTMIVVDDNEVVERSYKLSKPNDKGEVVRTSWQETTLGDLGLHREGAAVKTIDELYTECEEEVLTQNPEQNRIYLRFRSDGILHSCIYVPSNCYDDCGMGVRVNSIAFDNASEAPNYD